MKINELTNLWVGTNKTENFKILIVALDKTEAQKIANEYCLDSHMSGDFTINELLDVNEKFDCDYVITGGVWLNTTESWYGKWEIGMDMKELLGFWFIATAIIFGGTSLFGMELPLKTTITIGLLIELFITLLFIGCYLLGS